MFVRFKTLMTHTYWRFKRERANDAIKIARFLRRKPSASLEQITDAIWSCIPLDSRRSFDQHTASTLDLLARYGVIENDRGWRLTDSTDPFLHLVESTVDESKLVDAFGELAANYSGTIERRLAGAIATFVTENSRSDEMRRIAYIHFLSVVGIPVNRWPKPDTLLDPAVPNDFDWTLLNVFLPRCSRRMIL